MSPFIAQPVVCANPEKEETLGAVLGWITNTVHSDAVRPAMKKHGLESFSPNKWYSTQALLNVVRDLYKEPNTMDVLIAIGKKFALEYPFDAKIKTISGAIFAFNETYRAVHRGIDPEEGILIQEVKTNTLNITNNTPFPGEIIYGILWTLPSRFETNRTLIVKFLEPDDFLRSVIEVVWK